MQYAISKVDKPLKRAQPHNQNILDLQKLKKPVTQQYKSIFFKTCR